MRSNFHVTTQRGYWDWTQDSYEYPDINDIIEQEERLREEKRAKKRGKKSVPTKQVDAQNIKVRLVLGLFVSKEELKYLYQHSNMLEIAELDRLFGGQISAAGLGRQSERGIDHGYHEGYTSDVVEVDGRRIIVILNILCRLDVVFLKQHSYDIFLSLTHRFSFPSCHKKSASCVIISILSQFADFLQTFFQRLSKSHVYNVNFSTHQCTLQKCKIRCIDNTVLVPVRHLPVDQG